MKLIERFFYRNVQWPVDDLTRKKREYQTYALCIHSTETEKQTALTKLISKLPRICSQDSLIKQSFDAWGITISHFYINRKMMNEALLSLPKNMASVRYNGPRARIILHREFVDISKNPNNQMWLLLEYLCVAGAIVIPKQCTTLEATTKLIDSNGTCSEIIVNSKPSIKKYSVDEDVSRNLDGFFAVVKNEIKICHVEIAFDSTNRFEYNTVVHGMHWYENSTCYSNDFRFRLFSKKKSFLTFYDKALQLRETKGYVRKTDLQARIEFRFTPRNGLCSEKVTSIINSSSLSGTEMIEHLSPYIAGKLKKLHIDRQYFVDTFSDNEELVKLFSAEPGVFRSGIVEKNKFEASAFCQTVKQVLKECVTDIRKLTTNISAGFKSINVSRHESTINEISSETTNKIGYILCDFAQSTEPAIPGKRLSILRKLSKLNT